MSTALLQNQHTMMVAGVAKTNLNTLRDDHAHWDYAWATVGNLSALKRRRQLHVGKAQFILPENVNAIPILTSQPCLRCERSRVTFNSSKLFVAHL